jgi:glutaminyl-peptide cyclotransferase
MKRSAQLMASVMGIVVAIGLLGCQPATPAPTATDVPTATATNTPGPTATATLTATPSPEPPAERLKVEVLAMYPHDRTAFTQGLVIDGGRLFESTGRYGASELREVDLASGRVLRSVSMGEQYFGEGLALYNGTLIQLTWREKLAFLYDKDSFGSRGQMVYDGEGWGLCFDGQDMIMSDGSDGLNIRSPETFQAKSSLLVTLDGEPVMQLNELECVGDLIYANVWHTDTIMRIERGTGRVSGVIDAAGLLTAGEAEAAGKEGVLNGIAYDAARDVFLITGKNWPKLFEVRFVAGE